MVAGTTVPQLSLLNLLRQDRGWWIQVTGPQTEKAQIRFRLGLDGSTNTQQPTPDLANQVILIDVLADIAGVQQQLIVYRQRSTLHTIMKIGSPVSSVSADIESIQTDVNTIEAV